MYFLQEAGFTYVELNASDTRSKKSLQTEVAELLGNHTLMDYMGMYQYKICKYNRLQFWGGSRR